MNELLAKHDSLFVDKIGRMKEYKANIFVKSDATPKFVKARPVPFALQDSVEADRYRLRCKIRLRRNWRDWNKKVF